SGSLSKPADGPLREGERPPTRELRTRVPRSLRRLKRRPLACSPINGSEPRAWRTQVTRDHGMCSLWARATAADKTSETLGAVIPEGASRILAGEPREIAGHGRDRYVYAPFDGVFRTKARIGDAVRRVRRSPKLAPWR